MAKKQFKAESKRLLDMMIHSIYTHKEIFLRELISNASDAIDKLAYRALTDDKVGISREDFAIVLTADKENRTLTLSDNGIGMTREELEENLGTIAKSGSLQFKKDTAEDEGVPDIIGQFGVGFYSAFMVADSLTVTSRAYGSEDAYCWQSNGADGYTITPCDNAPVGTTIVMHIKKNEDEEDFDQFLNPRTLSGLVKKYSDYIRYPIRMELEQSRMKEKPADAPEDYKPEWETVLEWETVNSMVPLWQRPRSEVTADEYNAFYKEKFGDWEAPLSTIHLSAEGTVEYKALLYLPGRAPFNFNSRDYEKGLQLYSSGVMVMEKCPDLLPDHFRFVQGVVDSQDFSLNISRELLQQTRQLKIIATNLEKKIKADLLRLQKEDFDQYLTFWKAFGLHLKYGVVSDYGAHKELLRDLLLFWSSGDEKPTTLQAYRDRMKDSQDFIYYACGDSAAHLAKLPQAERILDAGFEILWLTDEVDEFAINTLTEFDGKTFKSIDAADALPESDEDKKALEQKAEENKDILDFVKETLGDKIHAVRISALLKSGAVCMTAEGPVSLEMEKYFKRMEPDAPGMAAQRVLELNADSGAFAALRAAVEEDKALAEQYAQLLYHQALLIAGLPLEDPAAYTELVCSLMK